MARYPTSNTPITQSTRAFQYVFQIVLTVFLKIKNAATVVNPYQQRGKKTAGREKAGKPDCT
jgi:hypothetical protein